MSENEKGSGCEEGIVEEVIGGRGKTVEGGRSGRLSDSLERLYLRSLTFTCSQDDLYPRRGQLLF